jgi:Na+/H+-dicarboxylate symporter
MAIVPPSSTAGTPGRPARSLGRLTLYALAALGAGIGIGVLFLRGPAPDHPLLIAADGLIRAWTNAFRLLVLPLIASHLFLAIAVARIPPAVLGRMGLLAPPVFLGLLIAVFVLSFLGTGWLMHLPLLAGIRLDPETAAPAEAAAGATGGEWVDQLIPPNIFAAMAAGNILAVMIFTVAFALAARRLTPPLRETLQRGFQAVADVTFLLVEWLLLVTPVVLFALGLVSGARSGIRVGGALLAFTVLLCVMLLLATMALYPIATLLGRAPLKRFAKAVWPAQLTAVATRSSLATVPALMAGAESGLGISPACAGYVVPLGASLLKLSRAVSEPVTLLFLAGLLGIPLSLPQLAVFSGGQILLSTSTPGLPRMTSGTRSMPLYVAVGIPPEYVVLLAASTAVTDLLMTVLNSTGYLTATVLVARFAPASAPVAEPAPVPASG